ncbi:hypothetical protein, partial [Enterobacter hormaechei]|uniref:hypothetical protein n=1 Tax=Enterobacter hormaechei TaxID=158836 RepID=UPI00197AACDD
WSTSKTPSYTKSVSWQHHPKLHMRQFDVFVNYLAFAGVTLGMHFFDDLIIRKIIYVYKTMPEMGTNAGKQCGKNIRMIGDNNF